MNTKDLMIGDIVAYNGCVCRIYSIHGREPRNNRFDCKEYVTLQCGGLIDVGVDEVQPIELNNKILEKNDWEYSEDGAYEYIGDNYNPCIACYVESAYTKIASNKLEAEFSIKYIHELQHVLCICGLGEMSDNIKI